MAFTHTMLAKKALLLAKVEAEYGVDPTPVKTTDVVLAYDIALMPEREVEPRPEEVASFGKLGTVVGKQTMGFSFKVTSPGGAVGVGEKAVESALLQMCSMKETVGTAGSGALYACETAVGKSATLWLYIDGIVYKINGCKSDLTMRAVAGKAFELEFSGKGLYVAGVAEAFPITPTIPSGAPMICKGLTMEIVSAVARVETVELTLGNVITVSSDVAVATGVKEINITGRAPKFTANPEVTPTQITTFESAIDTPTNVACKLNLVAGTNGLQISIPKGFIDSAGLGEREGKEIMNLSVIPCQNTAIDDEILFTYHKAA